MRKILATSLILAALLGASILPAAASLPPGDDGASSEDIAPIKDDNLPDPLTTKQKELHEQAMEAKLNGKAYGKTHEVARGQYVELAREGEGAIWTVLGEFADLEHNLLPEPDRSVDNTSIWVPDFNRDYYLNMLFNDAPGASPPFSRIRMFHFHGIPPTSRA